MLNKSGEITDLWSASLVDWEIEILTVSKTETLNWCLKERLLVTHRLILVAECLSVSAVWLGHCQQL